MNFLDDRLPERFWSKCTPEPNSGCWIWIGTQTKGGYGLYQSKLAEIDERLTHRITYRALIGVIPERMDLDHLCRVRCCCNIAHLEPVTRRENLLRGETIIAVNANKTCCVAGHEYTVETMYVRSNGDRGCKICRQVKRAAWQMKWTKERREHANALARVRYATRKAGAL